MHYTCSSRTSLADPGGGPMIVYAQNAKNVQPFFARFLKIILCDTWP